MRGARDIDEEAPGKRHLSGEARALGADRLLGDLDQDGVALLHLLLDGRKLTEPASVPPDVPVATLLVLVVFGEIRGVEEACLLGSDVDESRLDAGQHRVDLAQVDIPDQSNLVGTVEHELDQTVVFEKRHPRFVRRRHNQNFAFQKCTSPFITGFEPSPPGPPQSRPRPMPAGRK